MCKIIKTLKTILKSQAEIEKEMKENKLNFDKEWDKWGTRKKNSNKKIP